MFLKRSFVFVLGAGLIALSGSLDMAAAQAGGRIDPDQLSKYGAAPNSQQAMKDRLFLDKAAETGIGEIELSKRALTKSGRDDVKSFAQSVIDGQTKLNAEIKPVADKLEASTPKKLSKQDQAECKKLDGLTGADFDKEYLGYLLKVNQKDLELFNGEAAVASAPDLSATVHDGQNLISGQIAAIEKLSTP